MPRRAMRASAALLLGLTLTSCAGKPGPVQIRVERQQLDPSLRHCADEPAVPTDGQLQLDADVMLWVEAVRQAGADCRGKLKALDQAIGR